MARRRRVLKYVGAGVGVVVVLAVAALLLLTQTEWGRERMLRYALDQLDRVTDGRIEIGRIEGNLLRRVRLIDVSIVDEQERPFLEADTIFTRFSLRGLLRQQILLADLRLVNARVVLDQPPGERWNHERIFRIEPDTVAVEPAPPGWGDWIELRNVVLVNGQLTVRTEWKPPQDATPADRQRAIDKALAGETRELVIEVPGGYQNVMEYRELHAGIRRITVAHPDTAGIPMDVARFSGLVQPFEPPAQRVRYLTGRFRLVNDTLKFTGVHAVLNHSRLAARGSYALENGVLLMHMRGGPVAFTDLRWLYPPLPDRGGGSLRLRVERRPLATRVAADQIDVAVGAATLQGRLDITTGDTLRIGPTDLQFARVETTLVENIIEPLDFPRRGELTGRLALRGSPRALRLDGDIRFADVAGMTSRVVGVGELGIEPHLRFRDLRLRFLPLHASLARAYAPELPVRGTIEGYANLTGRPDGLLQLESDLTLRDPQTGLSRVAAAGGVDQRTDELRLADLRVRVNPLRADLLREHVPDLPPGVALVGTVRLDGFPQRGLRVDGDLDVHDPATGLSRVGATGGIAWEDELVLDDLRVRVDPLQLELLRDELPELPRHATLRGQMRLDGVPQRALRLDGDLALHEPRSGESRFGATGRLVIAPELRFDEMLVRLHGVQLALLQEQVPDLPDGVVTGAVRLDGAPARVMQVDGELAHHDAATGTSEVAVSGGIAVQDPVRFSALDVRLEPLQMRLVHAFAPELPVGGVLTGTARLDGSPAEQIAVRGDLVHVQAGERSHVTGSGVVATGADGWARVDVTLQPLSLVTAGRFVPAAGLHGSVAGSLTAEGRLADLRVDTDLRVAAGGALRAEGRLDLASERIGYGIEARLQAFDLSAVTWRAPAETDLTGALSAHGRGTDPATMNARIAADLVDSEIQDVGADRVRLRLGIEGGLAQVDSSVIRLGTAEAVLDGSFGLTAARQGTLAYVVRVDSLHAFAPWLPGADTAVSPPRLIAARDTLPADRMTPVRPTGVTGADTLAEVRPIGVPVATNDTPRAPRADTLRVMPDTADVPLAVAAADAVLGADSALIAAAAGAQPVPRDSLAGSLRAEGVLRGNIEAFDVAGRVEVADFIYGGTAIGRGRVDYELTELSTPAPNVVVEGEARDVVAGALAFDSVTVDGEYRGARFGEGRASIVAFQDDATDYRLDATFMLSLERSELRLTDAALRFDTIMWTTLQPGIVSWGEPGIEVDNIELVSTMGGRIFIDGVLPVDGAADLRLEVSNLEVAQLAALLQTDVEMTGRLDLEADVAGTQRAPVMDGRATLTQAVVNGEDAPDVRATFRYVDRELTAEAVMVHEERLLAEVDARLPIDLALTAVPQRLLPGQIEVDIQADSLPIEAIPPLTPHVEDARGRVSGAAYVRGTFEAPVLEGAVNLDLGRVRIVPLGVTFDEIAGTLSLDGTTLLVDSLVAISRGPVRITGEIDVSTLQEPVFDLEVVARNARVMDTDDVRLQVDADVTVTGPITAVEVRGESHARSGMMRIPRLDEVGRGQMVNLDDPATFQRVDTAFITVRDRLRPRSPVLRNLDVDVALTLDRDFWLRSSEANVEIYTPPEVGPLRVGLNGGEGTFTLLGTINTDRGEYEFMSRRFNLTRGAVSFTGEAELDPFIQVAAQHEVRLPGREGFDIRVVIDGRLSDFAITLESTSQPPISQTDLLSYVAFGRDASSLLQQQGAGLSGQAGGAGELVGNVAALATQQLAAVALEAVVNQIEADAARQLGLDVFRITPADLPAEVFRGDYTDVVRGTEIEAGRYISPRLFVAGQIRAGLNRPGIRLEYWSPLGLQWQATWQTRFMPAEPTLTDRVPDRRGVLGAFVFREWRF